MRWWCWHKWTKWIDKEYVSQPLVGRVAQVAMQERRCTKCGRLRVRRVADR